MSARQESTLHTRLRKMGARLSVTRSGAGNVKKWLPTARQTPVSGIGREPWLPDGPASVHGPKRMPDGSSSLGAKISANEPAWGATHRPRRCRLSLELIPGTRSLHRSAAAVSSSRAGYATTLSRTLPCVVTEDSQSRGSRKLTSFPLSVAP